MPLLPNIMSLDQTREPAMLKELERHFMPVSSPEMPVPTIRTGMTLLALTNAMFATGMPEVLVGAAMEFELDGAVFRVAVAEHIEAVITGVVGRAGAPPRARLFVAPHASPLDPHHLQPLFC